MAPSVGSMAPSWSRRPECSCRSRFRLNGVAGTKPGCQALPPRLTHVGGAGGAGDFVLGQAGCFGSELQSTEDLHFNKDPKLLGVERWWGCTSGVCWLIFIVASRNNSSGICGRALW